MGEKKGKKWAVDTWLPGRWETNWIREYTSVGELVQLFVVVTCCWQMFPCKEMRLERIGGASAVLPTGSS